MPTELVVHRLKGQPITLKIHAFPEEDARHFVISDSAFDPSGRSKPQHGWLQGVTTKGFNPGERVPMSLLSWRSRRIRRKAGSATLCESISLSTSLGALEKQVAMWCSITLSRFDVREYQEVEDTGGLRGPATVIASEDPNFQDPQAVAVVDAKSVFDTTSSEQACGEDDRTALEVAVIQDSISRLKGRIRWIPHNFNPADMLTKLVQAHEEPMMKLLTTGCFQLREEDSVLAQGKQSDHRMKTRATPTSFLGAVEESTE